MQRLLHWIFIIFYTFFYGFLLYTELPYLTILFSVLFSALLFMGELYNKPSIFIPVFLLVSIGEYFFPGLMLMLPSMFYLVPKPRDLWPIVLLTPLFIISDYPSIPSILFLLLNLLALWFGILEKQRRQYYAQYINITDTSSLDLRKLKISNQELMEEADANRRNDILQERNRIAREIHDNVGHKLTSAILQISALDTSPSSSSGALEQIQETLEEAMHEVRKSIHQMHDESLSFRNALERMVDKFTFCPVHLSLHYQAEPPARIYYVLLMVSREALSNTAKHSNAKRMDIHFREDKKKYHLLIRDNGTLQHEGQVGMGLLSMEERILSLGGSFYFNKDKGFRIFMQIPKEEKS